MSDVQDSAMLYLHDKLMHDYVKEIRPAVKHDRAVNVTFGFSLTQIIDLDERDQTLSTNAWVNMNWFDSNLKWSPAQHNNITQVHLPYTSVWKPDILLYNNADSKYPRTVVSTDMFVTHSGNVTWMSAAVFRSSCLVNVRYYPFDEQICTLTFASWAYDATKIQLLVLSDKGDETNFMKSSEWIVKSISVHRKEKKYSCCPLPFPYVDVEVQLLRRPMFYVLHLVLPAVCISYVALLVFCMPGDCGEKVTTAITTLLSMTVFLMMVAESMPPTSDTLPLIGKHYGVTTTLASLCAAFSVLTLNMHHKGQRGKPVPQFVRRVAFYHLAPLIRVRVDSAIYVTQRLEADAQVQERMTSTSGCDMPPLLESLGSGRAIWRYASGSGSMSSNQGVTSPLFGRRVLLQMDTDLGHNDKPSDKDSDAASDPLQQLRMHFDLILNRLKEAVHQNQARLDEQDRRQAIVREWRQVAMVLDRALLVLFTTFTIVFNVGVFYQKDMGQYISKQANIHNITFDI